MKSFFLLSLAITNLVHALTIQIDYTYDTSNFFNTQAIPAPTMAAARGFLTTASEEPRVVEGCGHPGH